MSLIGKKLLLNECLESCSAEQLASLQSLTDSLGTPTLLRLSTLTASDKGVKYATCWLDNYTVVHGLFIYTDTKCGLFAFQDEFNNMEAIKIDPVNKNFEYVHEHLSATEFRSTLDDVANAGSGGGDVSSLITMVPVSLSFSKGSIERREVTEEEKEWLLNFNALFVIDGSYGNERIAVTLLNIGSDRVQIAYGYTVYSPSGNIWRAAYNEIYYDKWADEVSTTVYEYDD